MTHHAVSDQSEHRLGTYQSTELALSEAAGHQDRPLR